MRTVVIIFQNVTVFTLFLINKSSLALGEENHLKLYEKLSILFCLYKHLYAPDKRIIWSDCFESNFCK